MTNEDKNKKYPIKRFRLSDDVYKLMKKEKESLNITWEDYFIRNINNG